MATDLFNNPINDYVNPGLSPCAGVSDDSYFQIGKGSAEIISGSDILAMLDLSGIQIPVSAYSIQTQILSKGEVIYIPGLTKGLQQRSQGFTMPELYSDNIDLNPYFFTIDLSISYYKNFKYITTNIDVSANYDQNINIVDALNIAFGEVWLDDPITYDPSIITFTGNTAGFDFNITNVVLGIIDASENASSPFPVNSNLDEYLLEEDPDADVPYASYPNGASQGIVMKSIYPSSTPNTPYDKWLYINHVHSPVIIYDPIEIQHYDTDIIREFIPPTIFGPFVGNVSTGFQEVTLESIVFSNDAANNCTLLDCSVNDSSIYNSSIYSSKFGNSSIEKCEANIFNVDSSERSFIDLCIINDSSVWNATVTNSNIYNTFLYDVSLIDCSLYNCTYTDPDITDDPLIYFENCVEILMDASIGMKSYYLDSSTYYTKTSKKLDVGMNGISTDTVMSAGDYLDWVNTNDYWNKFGDIYIWTSAPDGCSSCQNLINGFYVFNPHTFDIKIQYMLFI